MKGLLFLFTCCLLTGFSLTDDVEPAATVQDAMPFNPTKPTPKNTTTAAPHNTTTAAPHNTTTAAPTTKPAPHNTTTAAPHNTTTAAPTTKPAPHNTTTAAPHNTTTKPAPQNTTTAAPHNTTTAAPPPTTNPAPQNTTTTAAPPKTTTPVIPPTTTASPTAPTNLTVGNYTLVKDNATCLMALMELQIRLQTPKVNGTFVVQPSMTKAEGDCKGPTANLTLVFREGFITLLFNKSVVNNTVYVDALSFSLSYPFTRAGNGHYKADNKSIHLFPAKIGHSYSCRNQSLYMGEGLYLEVSKGRMQAFNLTHNDFGFPDPCPADQPDYRVAVAVGVTLLVLIVIVLVVYLLGRRRRTDGYQSL